MKRSKPSTGQLQLLQHAERLQVLSEVVNRALLASNLGQQYGGDRDIYQALGYPTSITFKDYFGRYCRQDMAKAIIDRPVKATWQGDILIRDNSKEGSKLEEEWVKLNRKLNLKSKFTRVDRLVGIGQYGVLLLGLNDITTQEQFIEPVTGQGKKLIYVQAFSEDSAEIIRYEDNPQNERYGQPLAYQIEVADASGVNNATIQVHHTRIIHITDDLLTNEVLGTPRLEVVYNRLMDLEKLVGGDAEMFWRGARPGYSGKVDKDHIMTSTTLDDLKTQIDEYEHNLRRIFVNEGVDLKSLAQQVSDPQNHVDVQIQMISAVTGIPKRILTGSERGELSSTQDKESWLTYVQSRREEHAEPRIVRLFVDRCIELGILPKSVDGYSVEWQDLFSVSEKERVEIGKIRAQAIKEYTANPMAEAFMPWEAFLRYCLGLNDDEIEEIESFQKEGIIEEQVRTQSIDETKLVE